MEKLYLELKNKIETAENIIIFSHVNPDGDAIGSNLALNIMLEKHFNKIPDSVYSGSLPSIYSFMPHFGRLKEVQTLDKNKKYDLAVSLDTASKDRLASGACFFDGAGFSAVIDHHKTNPRYGNINIIDGGAACTGIVLNRIFESWKLDMPLDAARCIYTSMLTDTGGFRYDNTNEECFLLAAKLIKAGVSPMKEYRACYETKPQAMLMFQAQAVSNASFYNDGKIAAVKITQNDMKRLNAEDDYTEGIVEILRTVKNVEIAVLLKETKDGWTKVSLRSKNINLIPAVLDFGGGGHMFAAGCTIKKPVMIAFDKLMARIQTELKLNDKTS